ncbi:glycosyltransferase involved in cell wall biosynthesis [Chitinophaga skermanii]|uniref:Glycosyltransferase involved in cell wall biosynthesis n=2 Tax=Chitinophaga skermanii TaxID=331697 RepID=A0A327QRI6_9BACT|nr:glycosyltransferase involved in cell wall biosynthesis [Chitinophaga skermanii]
MTKPKIKVLQTIRQGLIGGGETHVLGLVETLDRTLFDPVVLSFTDGPMITRLNEMGVKNFVVPSLKAFDIRQWQKVKALLQNEQIDLVHAHGSRAASNLMLPAKWCGLPLIYTIHGWSFHDDQPFLQRTIRELSEGVITRSTRCNISVSASNQATGIKHIRGFKSEVINNGIDPRRFDVNGQYKDIRSELGIPTEHTLISYIARITIQKDPITLVKAFADVLQHTKDITLLVVGDGELKEEMMTTAMQLGIHSNIVYQPFRLDIPDILHASDVYCLPSLWEGMPIGLLEAMAMGNAVIATQVDGSREIIQHLENGWLVEPGNKELLANAMLKLHEEKYFRTLLQKNAVTTVLEKYNLHHMTRSVEDIYLSVMQRKRPSSFFHQTSTESIITPQ